MKFDEIAEYALLETDDILVYYDEILTYFTVPHKRTNKRMFVNKLGISEAEENQGKELYLCSILEPEMYNQIRTGIIDIKSGILNSSTQNFILGKQTYSNKPGDVTTTSYPYYVYSTNNNISVEYLPSPNIFLI